MFTLRPALGWGSGDGPEGMAFPPGFLAVESAPGPLEGHCRSRGGSEKGSWLVGFLSGIPTPEEGRSTTPGCSEEFELATAAAARMLTRTTSAGRAGALGCWIQPNRSRLSKLFGAFENARTQKWSFE